MEFNYSEVASGAVAHAKQLGIETLDYTEESVRDVEIIMEYIHKYIDTLKQQPEQLWSFAEHYGVYIGETMLRNGLTKLGFSWHFDGEMHVLKSSDTNVISPITKVYKRICNGSVDNVYTFYKIALDMANGNTPSEKLHRAINIEMSTNQNVLDMPYSKVGGLIDFLNDGTLSWLKLTSHDGYLLVSNSKKGFTIELNISNKNEPLKTYHITSKEELSLDKLKDVTLEYYKNITEETFLNSVIHELKLNI